MLNGKRPYSVRHDGCGGGWEKLVLSSVAGNLFVLLYNCALLTNEVRQEISVRIFDLVFVWENHTFVTLQK